MKELLLKRRFKFTLYVIASFFPVISDLLRTGVFALFFQAIQKKDKDFFYLAVIIAIVYLVVQFLLQIASRMMRISFMRDTILDVRINAFEKILNTSYKAFNKKSKDIYISNLVNDINTFETNFFLNLLNFIFRGGTYVISLIILLVLDLYLGLAVFIVSVLIFFFAKAFEKKTHRLEKAVSTENENFTLNISNVFNGLEILKLNNIETKFINKSFDSINKLENTKHRYRFFTESQRNMTNMFGYVIYIAILVYLLTRVQNGLEYGMVMLLIQLSINIVFALQDIFPRLNVIRSSSEIYEKITKPEDDYYINGKRNDFNFNEQIKVKDLNFEFDGKVVFKDANCVIERGKKYLIKGPSGVGKSTLIKLLSMIHDDYQGTISVDGIDYKTIKSKTFNNKVSFVYQDVFLFEDTIKNNITLYKDLDDDVVLDAIYKAGLKEFIDNKEEGILDKISENGKNLSGGERQRISIARAIAKDADILFVDEGTSALNEDLGRAVEDTFLSLKSTVISISHRYYKGITDKYDYVLEIKNGKIITHKPEEFFKEEAIYA